MEPETIIQTSMILLVFATLIALYLQAISHLGFVVFIAGIFVYGYVMDLILD